MVARGVKDACVVWRLKETMHFTARPGSVIMAPQLRGVEDHELQSCVDGFVEAFRRLLVKHIGVARSDTSAERTQVAIMVDVVLDDMRDEVREMLDQYVAEVRSQT